MKSLRAVEASTDVPKMIPGTPTPTGFGRVRALYSLYVLASVGSMSLWLIAIRAPLWLDETSSYWQIKAGFWQIPARQGISFAAHSYILWLSAKILGTSEVALRIPEVLAMLGAAYLLYLVAREMFEQDVAFAAAIIFALHPIVIEEAIDARPYAFAVLAINASILCLVRLRRSRSTVLAALFGCSAACILYFQTLFGVILPSLLLCFFVLKGRRERREMWKQLGVALTVFLLTVAPALSRVRLMLHSGRALAFEKPPHVAALVITIAPLAILFIYAAALIISAATQKAQNGTLKDWRILISVALGIVPILILFVLSVATPVQVFVPRYRLVAIPGIALSWAFLVSVFHSRWVRLAFCLALFSLCAYFYLSSPYSREHFYTWKYALRFAEENTSADRASILICSDFPQSPLVSMPVGEEVKDSSLFTQLSYYTITAPVVGMPRALNDEAIRNSREFLRNSKRKRFLALAYRPSYPVLDWLIDEASTTHEVHLLGTFDGVRVLEFTPDALSQTSK